MFLMKKLTSLTFLTFIHFPSVLRRVLAAICLCFLATVTAQANLSSDQVLLKIQQEKQEKQDNQDKQAQTGKNEPKEAKKVKEAKALKSDTLIWQLAQSGYALMFFFDSKCPHCHNFAPIVKSVSDNYGFHVFDFSFDNQGLPSFPTPATVTQAI